MSGLKCNFEYHVPKNTGEMLDLLAEYQSDARIIDGGTDLIPKINAGVVRFSHLLSMKELSDLNYIHFQPDDGLHIGAASTLRDAEKNRYIAETYPALWLGVHSMASTQIRNRGTICGNICNAVPSADTAPALLVYHADVTIRSKRGKRVVPIEEFFTGVCRTVLQPDELLTEIHVPVPDSRANSIYYKYTIRNALDLAMIGVAANGIFQNHAVKDIAVALGAVAVTPKRAPKTEAFLTGKDLTDDVIEEAARLAAEEDCRPISDIRASAEYRREMVRVHTKKALRYLRGDGED